MTEVSSEVFARLEQEAYHACREWHLWLILRRKQLERTIQHAQAGVP